MNVVLYKKVYWIVLNFVKDPRCHEEDENKDRSSCVKVEFPKGKRGSLTTTRHPLS